MSSAAADKTTTQNLKTNVIARIRQLAETKQSHKIQKAVGLLHPLCGFVMTLIVSFDI